MLEQVMPFWDRVSLNINKALGCVGQIFFTTQALRSRYYFFSFTLKVLMKKLLA